MQQYQQCRPDKVLQTASVAGSRCPSGTPASIMLAQHVQTASIVELQKVAESYPSWSESALPSPGDTEQLGGLLHSEVVLETLNRQKHAALVPLPEYARPSVKSDEKQSARNEHLKHAVPGSPKSKRYVGHGSIAAMCCTSCCRIIAVAQTTLASCCTPNTCNYTYAS